MKNLILFFIFLTLSFSIPAQSVKQDRLTRKAYKKLDGYDPGFHQWEHIGDIKIDSISLLPEDHIVRFFFSTPLSYLPVRENNYLLLRNSLRQQLGWRFRDFEFEICTDNQLFETLIPNYYRVSMAIDSSRFSRKNTNMVPMVRKVGQEIYRGGLSDNHIALWHSHGWYYESKLDRWEWQRARLHGTVEDIFPITFVLPYLVPMLENAGANVFLPRERDIQMHEVIVDNDILQGDSRLEIHNVDVDTINGKGFAWKDTLHAGDNPFILGSFLKFETSYPENGFLEYIPDIPEKGDYAVYVSFGESENNVQDVLYSVMHTGGQTDFLVNQQMGYGTWIYLGTFHFNKGIDANLGSVKVHSISNASGQITSDAIRFGGGMGNVARRPASELIPNQRSLKDLQNDQTEEIKTDPESFSYKISGKPRYMEAARYYLQYAGFPDTLVFSLNDEKNDYNDDYQSRGEWVNFLMGNPNGPNGHREVKGLNIPIDLSFAFHTDAGVTPNDSVIGTLGIYSSIRDNGIFPSGQSKMVSRDLTDIIQTQIVNDVRVLFNPDWTRRGLWNREYSEAWRPNAPAMLLELLSHQNLADMRWGLDPRFRFHISRAIYKGILRFLTYQENRDYAVQPLPVHHFSITYLKNKTIRLEWRPQADPLELSANPLAYKLYQRIDNNGFDNGRIVRDTSIILTLEQFNRIYSFKVTAFNNGGESFPSEILSAGFTNNDFKPALVVNAFDRICGPAFVDNRKMAGIAWWDDPGVSCKYEFGQTGVPYDFDRNSPWLDDDSPGWGASYGNLEGLIIPGNNFDYPYVHGDAIMKAGYSFISMSDEAFCNPSFDPSPFSFTDVIFGEEKTTPDYLNPDTCYFRVFTPEMRQKLAEITSFGGDLFISGSYIGSDYIRTEDSLSQNFVRDVLHYTWRTDHAVKTGGVYSTDYAKEDLNINFLFNTDFHPYIYTVESPDAIEPAGDGAITAFRYRENNAGAGILYKGTYKIIALGFPYETIITDDERKELMKQVIFFFNN